MDVTNGGSPEPTKSPSFWKRSRFVVLTLLAAYLLGFGGGCLAGRLGWTDLGRVRTSKLFAFNRDLELLVPGYGDLLQAYKAWERQKLYAYIFSGKGGKALLLMFFNNWVVANLTMVIRAGTLIPMLLYPYGRFVQGLTFSQTPATFQIWGTLLCEFGGYLLTICGTLCALAWTLFPRRFGFGSRKAGLRSGLIAFGLLYGLSGFFLLLGSYFETMSAIGLSLR
jgi:hypothetical protein